MSRMSELYSELYDEPEEYEMSEEAQKDLNDYSTKPVTVSNDTPAGRATNKILDKCDIKGMQPDEVRDIIEAEYAPLVKAANNSNQTLEYVEQALGMLWIEIGDHVAIKSIEDVVEKALITYRAAKGS